MKAATPQHPAPTTLRITLFGTSQMAIAANEAAQDGQPVQCPAAGMNLLICLAAHAPRPLSRTQLIGLLFPDHQPNTARKALTDATYRLKAALNEALLGLGHKPAAAESIVAGWLVGDAHATHLNPQTVHIDCLAFRALAKSVHLADWERALALYQGDLVEDLDAEWMNTLRRALLAQQVVLLERTCEALSQTSRLADALALAHLWAQADPWRDEAHMAVMRLYLRQHRRTSAIQHYDVFARTLKAEMKMEPKSEARDLAQAIQKEFVELERSHPEPPDSPFVGRLNEYGELLRAMELTYAGQGGIVLLEGESGMGKTRLLERVTASARWRGWFPVWGITQQHASSAPCTPLDQALRLAISEPNLVRLREALPPTIIALLSNLVPALRQPDAKEKAHPSPLVAPVSTNAPAVFTPASSAAGAPENWLTQKMDLAEAVVAGVLALAKCGPQLFVLDDVQWADPNLWEVLLKLASHLAAHPVLFVLSYRPHEIHENVAAWRALQELELQLRPTRLPLDGLSIAECAQLSMVLGKPLNSQEAASLHAATAGKPLFVAGITGANKGVAASRSSFQTLFEGKLISLTPQVRNVLEAAAVLGREFTHVAWQWVSGADVSAAMPTLKKLDLVSESERGYRFPHDFVHEQVYAAIGPERLRDLHKRANAALHNERAEPGVLAWHAAKAGVWREAVRQYSRAGDKARMAYAYASALEQYARGFDLLDNLELHEKKFEQLRLLCGRQIIYGMGLRIPEWRADIEAIEILAEELGATVAMMAALEARMTLALFDSDMEGIRKAGERAVAMAKSQGNRRAEVRIANILGMHLANRLGQAERARKLLQDAVSYASSTKDSLLHVSALCNLSGAQRFCGNCNEAKELALSALTLSQLDNQMYAARADALQALGCAEWFLARWPAAHADLEAACQLHSTLNNLWAALDDTLNFAMLNAHMGDFDAAIAGLQHLQTLGRRVGLAVDSDLWKWSEALLAEVYVLAGELDKAEQVLLGMADWMSQASDSRQLLSALQAQGRLLLERGEPACALQPLTRAKLIWQREQTVQIKPLLLHALAAHQCGDAITAKASLKLAEQRMQRSDVRYMTVQLHWVRFMVLGDGAALGQAREELRQQAAQFADSAMRDRFLNQIQLHRQVETAWQARTQSAQATATDVRRAIVRLARKDAPLGRKLGDEDRIDVTWTLDAGADDSAVLQQAGKVGLRQHRLQRLLEEASAQNAAPTDEDLARALAVQVRTIERDMLALGKQVKGLTRRR